MRVLNVGYEALRCSHAAEYHECGPVDDGNPEHDQRPDIPAVLHARVAELCSWCWKERCSLGFIGAIEEPLDELLKEVASFVKEDGTDRSQVLASRQLGRPRETRNFYDSTTTHWVVQ